MTKQQIALKLALDALENAEDQLAKPYSTAARYAITAIREALAEQPAKQQAGHTFYDGNGNVVAHLDATAEITMDYSKPSAWAQRKPLTDEEIEKLIPEKNASIYYPGGKIVYHSDWQFVYFARAIEAAHGIKGGA